MATVNKDFRVKHGLVVEGSTATVNGSNVLTEASTEFLQDTIGAMVDGGTQTNITVTYNDASGKLNFVAENGIADSTTSDLAEGSNLYFTKERAQDEAAALFTSGTHNGIEFSYDDQNNAITATVTGAAVPTFTTGIVFEGSVADGNETTFAVTNPTADRTITFKDESGTVAFTSDITTAIDALTTDDIEQGLTNKYFSDTLARGAVSAGDGLDYSSSTGVFSAKLGTGLQFTGAGKIEIDNTVVATDQNVSDAISSHNQTGGVHGIASHSEIVGTYETQTLHNKSLGTNLDAGTFTITNLGTPNNSTDAATKGYVDSVAEGLHVHASAAVATVGNINLSSVSSIDGVPLSNGMRVLVRAQSNAAENGIYVYDSGALSRALDYNSAGEVDAGDFVFVVGGDTYASTGWVQENNIVNLGTDAISWTQFSGSGTYTAGNGLTLDGTEFKINESVTATTTYVDTQVGDHASDTSTHGVTKIVGADEFQILTNKTLGSGTTLGANLDAVNTYKVTNLVDPTSAQDAATKNYVDTRTTTNITEGTNLYFTDERAQDAIKTLIDNGTQTNITVTYNDVNNSLSFNASGGVSSVAGTTNQVNVSGSTGAVTFSLPQDIHSGATPTFAGVNVPSVSLSDALIGTATLALTDGNATVVDSWSASAYSSAKYVVQMKKGNDIELIEILVMIDGNNNVYLTEYANIVSNVQLGTTDANFSGGNVRLLVTASNGTTVKVHKTLIEA